MISQGDFGENAWAATIAMSTNRWNKTDLIAQQKGSNSCFTLALIYVRTTRSHCTCMQFLKLKSIVAWNWTRLANETWLLQVKRITIEFWFGSSIISFTVYTCLVHCFVLSGKHEEDTRLMHRWIDACRSFMSINGIIMSVRVGV